MGSCEHLTDSASDEVLEPVVAVASGAVIRIPEAAVSIKVDIVDLPGGPMFVDPAACAVAKPFASTVATDVLVLL